MILNIEPIFIQYYLQLLLLIFHYTYDSVIYIYIYCRYLIDFTIFCTTTQTNKQYIYKRKYFVINRKLTINNIMSCSKLQVENKVKHLNLNIARPFIPLSSQTCVQRSPLLVASYYSSLVVVCTRVFATYPLPSRSECFLVDEADEAYPSLDFNNEY